MVSAWVTLFVYFLMMIVSYALGQHFYPIPYQTKKIVFFFFTLMLFSVIIVSAFQMNFWLSNTLLLVYIGLIGYSERALLKRLVKAKAKVKA